MIRVRRKLETEESAAAKKLIARCQDLDGTFRDPYLSNRLNFDPNMPAFFLCYRGAILLGLLTVYADDQDVEVTILVDPDHRRQGIARALWSRFEKETASFPIRSVTVQTERVFLEHHPDFISNWGLVEEAETEIWLGRDRTPYLLNTLISLGLIIWVYPAK
ncbi:Acetyltransferase, GNAT family [Streptococcus oralis]|uniref:Acetyltransferase, GNAT family n=1 Tax=Streptococcus oralis TaxID=1303 RepID=A0A139PGD7_STROR|nr:Acetyltransferase, GNAT family [Streptococcus oralis]